METQTHIKQKQILFVQEVARHLIESGGTIDFEFSASPDYSTVLIKLASGKAIAALDKAGFKTQVFEKGVRVYPKDDIINNSDR